LLAKHLQRLRSCYTGIQIHSHLTAQEIITHMAEMQQSPTSSLLGRIAAVAVLATIALVTVLGILPANTNATELLFNQIAAMQGSHRVPINPILDPAIEGELVYTVIGEQAVIRVSNLPLLPAEQTYQLWLHTSEGITSGRLFRPTAAGNYFIDVPVRNLPAFEYALFSVSLEPSGGSPDQNRPGSQQIFTVEPSAGQ
jgi:anti-sigma-K factor RskA